MNSRLSGESLINDIKNFYKRGDFHTIERVKFGGRKGVFLRNYVVDTSVIYTHRYWTLFNEIFC